MATSTITKKKPDHGKAIGLLEIPKEVLNNMRSITENLPKSER
jgi:hypothetical protein